MKKLTLLISILLIVEVTFSQITFQKTYGGAGDDYGSSVQQTTDGGYIIAGFTNSFGVGNDDIYLIKTDANGDTIWTKTFGGISYENGNSVKQTTDGGYIITGSTTGFGAGDADVYLIKTDANGDSLWTKTFGGAGIDLSYSVQQTTDGGYIISGDTYSFSTGMADVYLIKTDANGDSLWTKTFGGTSHDYGWSGQVTIDGGYIIAGLTQSFGAGGADVYLVKTDSAGNLDWSKTFGGTGYDRVNSIQQTTDGGYIITGYSNSFGAANVDVYLIKTDTNGDSLWVKTFDGTNDDLGWSVQQTQDGGYIITGFNGSFGPGNYDVYLIKTDSIGNLLWSKTYGGTGNDKGEFVQQTSDGGYIICAFTNSFGAGDIDIYLIKTDSLGNSGCNEGSTATIVTSPATIVTSPATVVTFPPTIVTSTATIVGSGGMATTLCTTIGINEITLDNPFIISPNPSAGNFIVSFEGTIIKGNVEIFNTLGENVFTENIFNETKTEVNLNIEAGIYFVRVFDGEKSYCKKLIIE